MRIAVDVNHPAHVHFFKQFIWRMEKRGHTILVTASSKDVTCQLLHEYGLEYVLLGSYGRSQVRKAVGFPLLDYRMWAALRRFKPDVILGVGSFRAAHVSWLLRTRCLIFDDTEHGRTEQLLYLPFAHEVYTPACFKRALGKKQIRYDGYHELAYLHPDYFQPNPFVLTELDLEEDEPFFVIRFVAWDAIHDVRQHGFRPSDKRKLVGKLREYGRVLVSSEAPLPMDLRPYQVLLSPAKMHDLLYYAAMYIGEGGTMATEAAILGTPSILVSSLTSGNWEELEEQYGLLYTFSDGEQVLSKVEELVAHPNLKQEWKGRTVRLLEEHIDVTAWLIQLVEGQVREKEMTGYES